MCQSSIYLLGWFETKLSTVMPGGVVDCTLDCPVDGYEIMSSVGPGGRTSVTTDL